MGERVRIDITDRPASAGTKGGEGVSGQRIRRWTTDELRQEQERIELFALQAKLEARELVEKGHVPMGEEGSIRDRLHEALVLDSQFPNPVKVEGPGGRAIEVSRHDQVVREKEEWQYAREAQRVKEQGERIARDREWQKEPFRKRARGILESAKLRGETFTPEEFDGLVSKIADKLQLNQRSGSWTDEETMIAEARK